jgi:predicted amidohydrolase YtcJ
MNKILLLLSMCCWFSCALAVESTTLQDVAGNLSSLPQMTIYPAKEIITLDPAKPRAEALAVVDDRILAVGTLAELKKAAGQQTYVIDPVLEHQVVVPGFIGQHDHPLLASLTMITEIISIEDWVLPSGTVPAAKSREEYMKRLSEANATMQDPSAILLTWGFHQYFHGKLTRADLDKISPNRCIIVWHRSAHEFILNSATMKKFGVTSEWHEKLGKSQKEQSNFENGHFWEQGAFAVMPLIASAIATPARLQQGLEFVKEYFHANGITRGCEPGGLASKPLRNAQNAVLSDAASPFRFFFIADGKSITAVHPDEKAISETEKLLSWGQGRTSYLPKQVKLFADGAIFSQAMQVRDPYTDGHQGEWMMDLEFFQRSFRVYWDADYQIHCHVNGDAGLDMVLNTLEENMRRHPRLDHRTVIVHFAISQPDQVERIKKLGAIVSGNPYYTTALADNYSKVGLGPERADQMVRMGDVERAGISYSFHSDMPMAPGQPLFLMHCGVNRTTQSGRIAGENQRVSREGALRAVTLDAAYSLRMEQDVGSIVQGKLANLTILSDNPVTCDPAKIKDIVVWGTMQEGRVQPIGVASGKKTSAIRGLGDGRTAAMPLSRGYETHTASPASSTVELQHPEEGSQTNDHAFCGSPGCSCSMGRFLASLMFRP